MRTTTTLIMITFLGLTAAQVHGSPAPGDNTSLTGVPMSTAKQPKAEQTHGIGAANVSLTGIPMSVAKQPKAAQNLGAGAASVALTGVPMSIGKQPKAAPTAGN